MTDPPSQPLPPVFAPVIELRSDTFTLPTPAMRAAMVSAPLGDDVYGEDPTVRELERLVADRMGKEAACLMPSGTMANLAAVLAHAPRGAAVLAGSESDIYRYEAGGAAVCGGVTYLPVPNQSDGTLRIADLAAELPTDPADPQFAPPALICLENTQNRCGGAVLPLAYPGAVRRLAAAHGLAVHLDGARIFNAAVALGRPVADLVSDVDSVQCCLSKGLSAPIGSVVAGGGRFVERVRRIRKMLGGGMRQAGVVAAAGIVALAEMVDRLAADHDHAARLAAGLRGIPGVVLDPPRVATNIVLFRVDGAGWDWAPFLAAARRRGLALGELGYGRIRAVTHAGISAADVDAALEIVAAVLATPQAQELGAAA